MIENFKVLHIKAIEIVSRYKKSEAEFLEI